MVDRPSVRLTSLFDKWQTMRQSAVSINDFSRWQSPFSGTRRATSGRHLRNVTELYTRDHLSTAGRLLPLSAAVTSVTWHWRAVRQGLVTRRDRSASRLVEIFDIGRQLLQPRGFQRLPTSCTSPASFPRRSQFGSFLLTRRWSRNLFRITWLSLSRRDAADSHVSHTVQRPVILLFVRGHCGL